ncbi:hypothetical protein EVAR_39722_1 [Eumeta japonica]|uniref:Uncharacterized protein n=1 Tax=Eumeta variegata TaxID=151549 RepID=A0A4C1W872_EUMVA|nr:hypothetical protein EVAR_39722_1 [Eumeta japonica]
MTSVSSIATMAYIGDFELTALVDCDNFAALDTLTFCDAGASWESVYLTVRQGGVVGGVFSDVAMAVTGAVGVTERVPGKTEINAFGFLYNRRTKPGPYVANRRGWREFRFCTWVNPSLSESFRSLESSLYEMELNSSDIRDSEGRLVDSLLGLEIEVTAFREKILESIVHCGSRECPAVVRRFRRSYGQSVRPAHVCPTCTDFKLPEVTQAKNDGACSSLHTSLLSVWFSDTKNTDEHIKHVDTYCIYGALQRAGLEPRRDDD